MPLTKVQGGLIESTNEPVILGAGSSTGTASQRLQVTGGAYISGIGASVGVGTTNPQSNLHIFSSSSNIHLLLDSTGSAASRLYFKNTSTTNAGDTQIVSQNNDLAFNTLGSERVRIKDRGALLVGSASSTGTANQLLQVTGGTYISGNTGIGTTRPLGIFHVVPASGVSVAINTSGSVPGSLIVGLTSSTLSNTIGQTTPRIQVNYDTSSAGISIVRYTNDGNAPYFLFGKSRGTTVGTYTSVRNGDSLGTIQWYGASGVHLDNVAAGIDGFVDGTVASNNTPGGLLFLTTNSAGIHAERVRITSSGDVGIGTTNPGAKLHVAGGNIKVDSGYGIDFSSNANAAGMTSELLDDYEVGSFTPAFTFSNLTVSSYLQQDGYYTKIGNVVHISIWVRFSGANLSGTPQNAGTVVMNLPFVSASSYTQFIGNPVAMGRLDQYVGSNASTDFNKVYFYTQNSVYFTWGVNKDPQTPGTTDFLYGMSEKSFTNLIGVARNFELRTTFTYRTS